MAKSNHISNPLVYLLLVSALIPMANAVVTPLLPDIYKYFQSHAHARLYVDMILALPGLAIAIASLLSGAVIDRVGRLPVLAIGLVLVCVSAVVGYFTDNLELLLASRLIHGVSIAAILTSCTVLIADYTTVDNRSKVMGLLAASMGFGNVAGLMVGGGLGTNDWHTPFLVYLVSLAFLPGLVWLRHKQAAAVGPATQSSSDTTEKGENRKPVLLLYLLSFTTMSLYIMIPLYTPFLLQDEGVVGSGPTGIVLGLFMLGCSVASLLYHRIKVRVGFGGVFMMVFGFSGLGALLMPLAHNYWMLAGALLIGAIGWGLYIANATSYLITLVPDHVRGKAIGRLNFAFYFGQFSAPFMGGVLARSENPSFAFTTIGVILLGICAMFFIEVNLRKSRRQQVVVNVAD